MTYDPNMASAGDLFSEADLNAAGSTVLVEEGEYTLALSARYNAKNGGIVFVEGNIQAGVHLNKNVKVCSVVLHKSPGQKSIAMRNIASFGIDVNTLNQIARQVGATAGDLTKLYEAIADIISGRVINAYLSQNTYEGKNGTTTDMQIAPGKASLVSAPAVVIGGAPATPAAVAPPTPTTAPAPVTAPAAAPAPSGVSAAEAVAPPAPAPVMIPAPLPVTAPATAPQAVPAQNEAAPAPVQPVAVAPAPVPAPVAPAGGVQVVGEPSF